MAGGQGSSPQARRPQRLGRRTRAWSAGQWFTHLAFMLGPFAVQHDHPVASLLHCLVQEAHRLDLVGKHQDPRQIALPSSSFLLTLQVSPRMDKPV